MKWKKFTIQTTTAAEDFISEKLSEIGIEGIEIEDKVELTANDTKGMFIDHTKMYNDTKEIFDELGIDIDPKDKVANLSVSQMQMIEIAKAFSYNAKIVIMDEPTSSLTEKEVSHLFTIIRKLKDRGCQGEIVNVL